jgi:hypothetical protein
MKPVAASSGTVCCLAIGGAPEPTDPNHRRFGPPNSALSVHVFAMKKGAERRLDGFDDRTSPHQAEFRLMI